MIEIGADFKEYLNKLKKEELIKIIEDYNKLCDIYGSEKIESKNLKKESLIEKFLPNINLYLEYVISSLDLKDYETLKKNSAEQEQVLKYATYLEKIGTSSNKLTNNSLTKLGQVTKEYAISLKASQKDDIRDLLAKIKRNQADFINEFYNTYHEDKTMNEYFTNAKSNLKNKDKEKDFVNLKNATKYLNYLIDNYKNPLKNSEVTEKTTYYLEYFLMIGQKKNCQDNDIVKFAQATKEYFLKNDSQ